MTGVLNALCIPLEQRFAERLGHSPCLLPKNIVAALVERMPAANDFELSRETAATENCSQCTLLHTTMRRAQRSQQQIDRSFVFGRGKQLEGFDKSFAHGVFSP